MQADGNLVLYRLDDSALPFGGDVNVNDPDFEKWSTVPMWDTGTSNSAFTSCNIDDNGILFLLNFDETIRHDIAPNGFIPATSFLRVQDDGNLVISTVDGFVRWHSNTFAGPR